MKVRLIEDKFTVVTEMDTIPMPGDRIVTALVFVNGKGKRRPGNNIIWKVLHREWFLPSDDGITFVEGDEMESVVLEVQGIDRRRG